MSEAQANIPMTLEEVLAQVGGEVASAEAKWPAMNSAHEAYAVLAEEMDELWSHVKTNQKRRDLPEMRHEAIQVAAMAVRFVREICDGERGAEMTDIATLSAERDTALLRRDALKGSLEIAQTLSEQQQTRIHALEGLLGEAGRLLRGYEREHLAKDPPQPEKARRNGDMAARIEGLLGRALTTQGDAPHATADTPFQAWATGDDETFGPDGAPHVELAATALQVWSLCQQRARVTVEEAALAFNVAPAMIREAADGHHWMMIVHEVGADLIQHEGE